MPKVGKKHFSYTAKGKKAAKAYAKKLREWKQGHLEEKLARELKPHTKHQPAGGWSAADTYVKISGKDEKKLSPKAKVSLASHRRRGKQRDAVADIHRSTAGYGAHQQEKVKVYKKRQEAHLSRRGVKTRKKKA